MATRRGFSLIEVIVALGLLVTVMATTAGLFATSLKQSNGQTQAQQAAVLADQQLDYTRSVPSGLLLSGRTGNWDTAVPPASTAAIPITMTPTVGGTKHTVTTFVDQCSLTAKSSADCTSNKQAVTINGSTNGVSSVSIVNSTTVTLKFTTASQFYGTVPVQVTSRNGALSDVFNWTVLVC